MTTDVIVSHPNKVFIRATGSPRRTWWTLRDAVRCTRGQVANAGLVPFIQTTGGRGFHVTAPLDATANSLR